MKTARIALLLLLIAIPVQGMKRNWEDESQVTTLSTLPTDLIHRIFSFCSPATRNVLTKINHLFKKRSGSSNAFLLQREGSAEISISDTMRMALASLSNKNVELFRTVMTEKVYAQCKQDYGSVWTILIWCLWRLNEDQYKQFKLSVSQEVSEKMIADLAPLIEEYPDRTAQEVIKSRRRGSKWLAWHIVYAGKFNEQQCAGIIHTFCACVESSEKNRQLMHRRAFDLLKMAVWCNHRAFINAMLGNPNYAKYLNPAIETKRLQWPIVLKHACVHNDIVIFELLMDWLLKRLVTDYHMASLLFDTLRNLVEVNKHQYVRIFLEKIKHLPFMHSHIDYILWYAFINEKYNSVDTLLEYGDSLVSSSKDALHKLIPERERRCRQVVDRVFTQDKGQSITPQALIFLFAQNQQPYLKMILEKMCRFSGHDRQLTYMLSEALKSKNYEKVGMILAYCGHRASRATNNLGILNKVITAQQWAQYLEPVCKDNDVRLYARVLEWLFWPMMNKGDISITDAEACQLLFVALGTQAIELDVVACLQELLKIHTQSPGFFDDQLSMLLKHALEKEQYASTATLLAAGALLNSVTSLTCIHALLKELNVPNIVCDVPDYITRLKEQRPDLFEKLVLIAQRFYVYHEKQKQVYNTLAAAIMQADVAQVQHTLTTSDMRIQQSIIISTIQLVHSSLQALQNTEITFVDYRVQALDTILNLLNQYLINHHFR